MKNETITLVATDLDGTFLDSKKKVPAINREAISGLKDRGILFGIASGRPIETVRPMIHDWGIEQDVSFIVGMNGGVLYDLRRRDKEEYHLISSDVVLRIIRFFEDLDVEFHVVMGPTRYTSKSNEKTRADAKMFGETEIEVNMHEFMQNRDINKLMMHFESDYMPVVLERASHFYDDRVVGFATSDTLFEYLNPHINKGFGMKKLAKHYGVPLETIMAFGDAPNDQEMLGLVGCGVCMANGSKESKMNARYVTTLTNDEGAVGHFIKEYLLEKEK